MSDSPPPVIAIDGPSASGKGTVAQEVARKLGYHYLDSGALYRLVALAANDAGLDLENELTIAGKARIINVEFLKNGVRMEGRDVSEAIRSEAISNAASRIAALPQVRAALLERQRAFQRPPGLVADGRDMGSVVFPGAALKIFLTASPEERAKRRYNQLIEKGLSATMTTLLHDIRERDARDRARAVAPLQKSADAIEIDTTEMTVGEVVAAVMARFERAARAP